MKIEIDELDKEELKTIETYLQGKYDDLGKKRKITNDSPKQLLQMLNTITRMLAFANDH
jgi:hypothetical protein